MSQSRHSANIVESGEGVAAPDGDAHFAEAGSHLHDIGYPDEERALRSAATAAVQHTASELHPADDGQADQMAVVLSQVFGALVPSARLAGHCTVLEAVLAGIAWQMLRWPSRCARWPGSR